MPILTSCPSCGRQLRVPDELLGRQVKCPSCNAVFSAAESPVGGTVAPPPLEEPYEGYSERDEFDDDDYLERRGKRGRGLDGLSSNYTIELGEWFRFAGIHYSAFLGPCIGYLILYGLITGVSGAIPFVGPIAQLLLTPPLEAGFIVVAIKQIQGRSWQFGDFFSGFQMYGSLLANYLLKGLIILGLMLPTVVAMIATGFFQEIMEAAQFQPGGAFGGRQQLPRFDPDKALIVFGIGLVNFLLASYVIVRATYFCTFLIVDRECGPIEAIQGSWTLSRGHFWGLFGCSIVLFLVAYVGILACCVGFLFTAPYALLGYSAGYVIIAGSRGPREIA